MARKNSVDIIIRAKDQASKKFRTIGVAAGSMGSMLKKAAAGVLFYLSARAIKNFVAESLQAYGRQEAAVKSLADALELLGIKDRAALKDLEKFASSIQRTTTYGDEAVLELMAMGVAMGKLSGEPLKKATKAAIGLATAYKMDVTAAMRLVARAAVGDTATLARYGIKLGDAKTKQEKFNKVLEIGARNFRLAEGEANTYLGRIIQMTNVLGDVFKEQIGEALMPMFQEWAKSTMEWAENNKKAVGDWAKKTVAYVALVKDVFMSFVDFMKKDWRTGLKYAFDVMLTIVKTAFKSAITMAFVAGGAIYEAIQEGLLGQKKGAIKIATLDLLNKFEPGIVKKAGERDMSKSIKQLNKEYFTVGTGLGGTRYIARENQEIYEKYKKLAEESFVGTNVKKAIGESFNIVIKGWDAAMKDIAGKMPTGMKADVDRAFEEYRDRVKWLIKGTGYAAYKPPGEKEEEVSEEVKKLRAGEKGKWSPLESRFLTMAPGSTIDIDRRTEKNTRDTAVALKRVENSLSEIAKILKNPNGGMKLGITNFS